MTEYFIVYDPANGSVRWRGQGPAGSAAQQSLPPGLAALAVPQAALLGETIDLAPIRTMVLAGIDEAAETARGRLLTPGSGQAQAYAKKEAEARTWTPGDERAHPDLYPFIVAEAAARDIPFAQLRAEILARVDALTPIAARIEAHRVSAKIRVGAASSIPDMIAGAAIDWNALSAG